MIHYISSTLYFRRHGVSKPAYTILQFCQLSLLIFWTATIKSWKQRQKLFLCFIWILRGLFTGMIMELCLALSLVRWSKYLGIDAAKLNVKHWLNLVAQVAWWVENCMIGASTRIGQVSRFPLTTAMIKPLAYINQTATLQLNVKFAWFWFWQWFCGTHTDIDLSTSVALQNQVLKPTYTNEVFQTLNRQISKWLWFL